ncbi:CATRA conflict system CASPASE/TPR repeat-associated protein [Dactylosporangium sp. CS-033363]|uniref:CATRA conflict system CASPASE/TPR repeat-associated protein n=1 Tax=Dactylosporangium sp. CS-033363 TaxID=3239935 RepID=UPI003D8C1C1D
MGSGLDGEAVGDALDVLGDVPQWRMPEAWWDQIAPIVRAMADAVAAGDSAALEAATARLELASPIRITDLDAVATVPAPPPIMVLYNHLCHALGAEPLPREPAAQVREVRTTEGLLTQSFVVHVFAPVDGPDAAAAYERVRELWDGCGAALGAIHPIGGLGLPAALPAAVPDARAIAACRSEAVQAILRREHDTLVLSVAGEAPGVTWAQWASRWEAVGGGGDDGALMATVSIFAGTVAKAPEPTPETAAAIAGALPRTVDEFWRADGTVVGESVLWQLPPPGDGRRRRLVVLAEAAREDALNALIWTRGGGVELSPLTHYLLHAAKVYYQRRVRDAMSTRLGELPDAGVWLEELRDAVEIARDNMASSLRTAGGPLAVDRDVAGTLLRQVEYDRRHTGRAPKQAAVPKAPTIGLVTAMPEEFAAMVTLLDGAADWTVAHDRAPYRVATVPSADPGRPHEVVLTLLGETGNDAAAHAAAHLVRSFPSVNQLIMVGIAAGVPKPRDPAAHVRLGDVVIGTWNVVDFDHIVDRPSGPERRQEFPRRSALLAARVKLLTAGELLGQRPWEAHLDRLTAALPDFARPDDRTDVLFSDDTDFAVPVPHPVRPRPGRPKVHEGRIGSSERSIRNAASRDEFAGRHQLRAIEMEGKGLGRAGHADGRDWFVVRGISDYGDRWLDTEWRRYAAAVAAAYVRALLESCPPVAPHGGHTGGTDGA